METRLVARLIHCPRVLLAEGWRSAINLELDEEGVIRAIRSGPPGAADSCLDGPVLPGMPNVHSHGFQVLIAGLTGRRGAAEDTFWSWREAMYAVAGRLDPDQFRRCMTGVYAHLLRGGYTSCGEFHYLHHRPDGRAYDNPAEMSEQAMAAAAETGIGLTLLPVLYTRSGFSAKGVAPAQARFAHSLDRFLDLVERCRLVAASSPLQSVGVAPHSLRAVAPEVLAGLLRAIDIGPVHMHVAEQPLEVEQCLAELGARPLEWLLDHAPVDARWCLVHATHLTPAETRAGAASGAVAGLCPSTEADLGDGIFDAPGWLEAGGRFAIGSDSNLRLSVTEELRLLEFGQRLRDGRRNVLATRDRSCGRTLYARAARDGGRALGQPVGELAVGMRADLLELDVRHPWLQGLDGDELLDALVFAGDAGMIRSVHVAGRERVRDGAHLGGGELLKGFARVMRELRS